MPDIDMNVSTQEPFVKAAKELCGEHGCYPLLAVGKLGEKSGFKLYADIRGIEPRVANDISKCIDQYNEALKQADDEEDNAAIAHRHLHLWVHGGPAGTQKSVRKAQTDKGKIDHQQQKMYHRMLPPYKRLQVV
jgi:hypothetical protein